MVGDFNQSGLNVNNWNGKANSNVGLAALRNFLLYLIKFLL